MGTLVMTPELLVPDLVLHDADHPRGLTGEASVGCDMLRRELRRPDLDDSLLRRALTTAIGQALRAEDGPTREALADQLLTGELDAADRHAVLACLVLPAPRAPLVMPVQTLERRRSRAFVRFLGRIRRARQN